MKWLKIGGVILGVLVLALAALPLFIPLEDYIPLLEKEASARLREPVTIKGLTVSGLPLPHVAVSGVSIGKSGDIQVGEVVVTPDLWSLLGERKVIRAIVVRDLVVTQVALGKLAALAGSGGSAPGTAPAISIARVELDGVLIRLDKAAFGPFDARLRLNDGGNLDSASLSTRDGKLKATVVPEAGGYRVALGAKDWKMPAGPALHFDELAVSGIATAANVTFNEVRAALYGGTVSGQLAAGWRKGLQLRGSAEVRQVEIRALLQALGKPASLSGKLAARPVFSASAAKAEQIADQLRLETPFAVQDGVLHGVDISKAATSLISRDAGKGGETRFDKLSGHLAMERGTRRLTKLNIVSGSLSAEGNVTVSPRDELSGRLNTKVKAVSITAATVALSVGGTLDSPLVYPSGGTVAGAAAGTAVLGPGIGTAVGARVGQWTEGLFGTREDKKQ